MQNCRICNGDYAFTGKSIKHSLFECMAEETWYEVPFDEQRWDNLVKHPFDMHHGSEVLTEAMTFFGNILWRLEERFGPVVMIKGSELLFAPQPSPMSARARWSKDYKNQRRWIDRHS